MLKKNITLLTKRELDIMNILWDTSDSLTASEIVKKNTELTMNTTQAVLRKLLKNNYIEVATITYSGTVLSRSYRPTVTAEEFSISQLTSEFQKLNGKVSRSSLVCALLGTEKDSKKALSEIEELENMLEEYKKKL